MSKALTAASAVRAEVKPGKQAIRAADRDRFEEVEPQRIVDSLDLDACLRSTAPNAPRWDYLVGTSVSGRSVVAAEVHPAYTSEVKAIVSKKRFALAQLAGHLLPGAQIGEWVWIASGPTKITRNMPQARLLAAAGIRLVGSKYVVR